ncbi:VOC family protein [Conexibacter stalactiti]|uniref:VOC family protein n=1 Tax=Conexibacter stalactiti TaxID=1940611 RepID=A0ABU4HIC0_9ACTN|nr:VOC family protein [Conexibacter stalactiti]MDW5593061.1 VOC family protein [Conexibacter stalactiti]MEC5033702.1 VOC family protein [Conexibacter stalactiti]
MTAPHLDHVGLSVGDLDAQRRFYARALGLTETEETFELPEAQVRTAILRSADGLKLELVERGGSTPQEFADPLDGASIQGYFHWALNVEDLDAVYTAVLRAGADAVSPPAPAVRPGARFAYVKDPEGNLLELIQPAA